MFAEEVGIPLPSLNRIMKEERVPKTEAFISILIRLREKLWELIESEEENISLLEEPREVYQTLIAAKETSKDMNEQILDELRKQTRILEELKNREL